MRFLLVALSAVLVRSQECVSTVAGVAPTTTTTVDTGVASLGTPFAVSFSATQGLLFTTSSAGVWALYSLSGGNAAILLCGGKVGDWVRTGVAANSTFYGQHVAVHPTSQVVYFDAHTATETYLQMIDSNGNLQVVSFTGTTIDLPGSSLGDQDNSLAFGSCVRRAHSAPHRDATSASPRDA